jgi:release factor glutamine methyltransferase
MRTEFLVKQAAARGHPGAVVVDLCCGSGAVGAALLAVLGKAEVYAADIDPAAVACARQNLSAAEVFEGDLFDPLPDELRGRVDILAANVPYVPSEEVRLLPAEAREYEPLVALDGGGDGLDVLRRVAAAAPQWLAPGGHLLVETSERQVPTAVAILEGAGMTPEVARSEEVGATVVIGRQRRPG